ncbi:MAG: glycosyltransferase [Chloroflexia bacterium]
MRVLFTSQPALGHWHPLVPLARALQAAGHHVAFASTPGFCPTIEAQGFPCYHVGLDETPDELHKRIGHMSQLSMTERPIYMWQNIFAGIRSTHSLPDLINLIDDWHPDLTVSENTEMAAPLAAEHANIPHATFQVTAARTRVLNLIDEPYRRLCDLANLPALRPEDVLHRYLLLFPRPLSFWDPSVPIPPTTHPFQYSGFDRSGEETLPDWVAHPPDRPTIYATLGTVNNNLTQLHSAILDALRDEPINLILTVGRNQDPLQFGEQPPNIHIERYIPQSLLLPHCDLAITHAGSGTVMDALSAGLPMVLIPIAADQPENARLCVDLGIARVISPDQRNPVAIREATLTVLRDTSYKQAAQKLQQEMQSLPGLDYPVALLEKLAAQRTPLLATQ